MKLSISDLMDCCTAEDIELTVEINTASIKTKTLARIRPKDSRHHKSLRLLLVAAVITTLLIGTVTASYITYLSLRTVANAEETIWYDFIAGTGEYQQVYHPYAQYAIDLEIPEDAKPQENMVYYRLNWLPSESPSYDFGEVNEDGWMPFHCQTWEDLGETIPYQINISTIQQHEFEIVYYLSGDTTLIKQDNWNGWNRMELTVDYTKNGGLRWDEPVNYLLLYSPDDNIFINICGMMDLKTFETIAENMEIKVSDEPYEYCVPNTLGMPAGMLDLSRG